MPPCSGGAAKIRRLNCGSNAAAWADLLREEIAPHICGGFAASVSFRHGRRRAKIPRRFPLQRPVPDRTDSCYS